MGLGTDIVQDVSGWTANIEKLLTGLAPGLGTAEEAFAAVSNVAKVIALWQADLNTPALQNASVNAKLVAFSNRINSDLATGNESDLEKLEAP
jgi:hypothetical protein